MDARKPEPLGRSLRIEDGDLTLRDGDLTLAAGVENLLQGLMVMMETPLGTDVFNVTYGFDVVGTLVEPQGAGVLERLLPVGGTDAERRALLDTLRPNRRELVRLNIVRALARDDRIQEVREVVLRPEDRTSRRWRADVVLTTVPEGELALRLEGPGV
jgi:hypothetical protein